jgi:hypothetical protein
VTSVRIFISVLALVLAVATARQASAQQAPPQQDPNDPVRVLSERPYRGIFGGGTSGTAQLLTLGLNMGGGIDSSVFIDNRDEPDAVTPVTRQRSGFVQGSANVNYSLSLTGLTFGAGAGAAGSWYPDLDLPASRYYYGNLNAGWAVSRRASIAAGYSLSFQPINHFVTLPGLDSGSLGPNNPFDNTLGAESEAYRTEQATAEFHYRLTERIATSIGYGNWRIVSPDRDHDVSTHHASARLSYRLTKTVGVFGAYRADSGDYQDDTLPAYVNHGADFGLDFAKALSLTRRTTMTFGAGTTAVTNGIRTEYALTGNVDVNREIARTWLSTMSYRRNVGFSQTFRQPVYTDTVSARISGLITQRYRFDLGVGAVMGSVGFDSDADDENGYRSIYTTTGVGFALSRLLSGGVRYSYSHHRFDSGIQNVPTDLTFQAGRHGVNVYLSSWIPLLSRTRRP